NAAGCCGQRRHGGQVMGSSIRQSAAPAPRPSDPFSAITRPWAAAIHLLLLSVLAIAAILAAFPRARAAESPVHLRPGEARSGTLLLRRDGDRFSEAPLVATDVDMTVSGPTARARVTQLFHNPTDGWVEAIYVYPLPEGGAVDTLKMVVGERIIVGDV